MTTTESAPSSRGILSLPPELFAAIANHLQLPTRPLSLRSLAITSRYSSQIVIPNLLYEHIIIHNEKSLISVVDILCRKVQMRSVVRGIYIRAFLASGQDGERPAIARLRELFHCGNLPGVHTLDLRLGSRKEGKPESFRPSNPFESLDESFWTRLNACCPNLRNFSIDRHNPRSRFITCRARDLFPWNRHMYLSSLKSVTSLSLVLSPFYGEAAGGMLQYIATISPQLEALHLRRKSGSQFDSDVRPRFAEGSVWERHPKLSYVDIRRKAQGPFFPSHDERLNSLAPLLPNLRYLTLSLFNAEVEDIERVSSRLGQLFSLGVISSYAQNCHTLLQDLSNSVCFQSLKVLYIESISLREEDGEQSFITPLALVELLGTLAPNVEEIIVGQTRSWDKINELCSLLGCLKHLKRFFFCPDYDSHLEILEPAQEDERLVSLARIAVSLSPSITAVGNMSNDIAGSYVVAEVIRTEDGEVEVLLTTGPASLLVRPGQAFLS
ncbi:hypothetical protein BKA70DRAFT_1337392 [Coprinopsis sp. MPI-PUGE-AT-0042]|nr:hypothetical protein BKA70DRAFT_1337392 [Coprinopsis sp. MPI-PUGE-AT-0042]